MPFRVNWGPGPGAVTVIVETAREARALAADYAAHGREDIVVSTLDGAQVSEQELEAMAADGSPDRA